METYQQIKERMEEVEKRTGKEIDHLLLFATDSEELSKEIETLCDNRNAFSVRMDNEVLEDFVNQLKQQKQTSVGEFISDDKNRALAKEKALSLWSVVANGMPLEKSSSSVFNTKDVVKRSTLSYSKTNELLDLLELFGFIQKLPKRDFKFVFSDEDILNNAKSGVVYSMNVLLGQIGRYKTIIESSEISEEKKVDLIKEIEDKLSEVKV